MNSRTSPEYREKLQRRKLARRKLIRARRKEAEPLGGYTVEDLIGELAGELKPRGVRHWLGRAGELAQASGLTPHEVLYAIRRQS